MMMILFPQACITDNFILLARKTKSPSKDQFTLSLEDCEHGVGHFMCVPPSKWLVGVCVWACSSLHTRVYKIEIKGTYFPPINPQNLWFFYETKNAILIKMCMILIVAIKANIPIPNPLRCLEVHQRWAARWEGHCYHGWCPPSPQSRALWIDEDLYWIKVTAPSPKPFLSIGWGPAISIIFFANKRVAMVRHGNPSYRWLSDCFLCPFLLSCICLRLENMISLDCVVPSSFKAGLMFCIWRVAEPGERACRLCRGVARWDPHPQTVFHSCAAGFHCLAFHILVWKRIRTYTKTNRFVFIFSTLGPGFRKVWAPKTQDPSGRPAQTHNGFWVALKRRVHTECVWEYLSKNSRGYWFSHWFDT